MGVGSDGAAALLAPPPPRPPRPPLLLLLLILLPTTALLWLPKPLDRLGQRAHALGADAVVREHKAAHGRTNAAVPLTPAQNLARRRHGPAIAQPQAGQIELVQPPVRGQKQAGEARAPLDGLVLREHQRDDRAGRPGGATIATITPALRRRIGNERRPRLAKRDALAVADDDDA